MTPFHIADIGARLQHDVHIFKDMSLRDYFACTALNGVMSQPSNKDGRFDSWQEVAKYCYDAADAMLQEREKRNV